MLIVSRAIRETVMRMIIEAQIEDNVGRCEPVRLAEFERADGELKQLGLTLAEGRNLMFEAQRALVNAQAQVFVLASRTCCRCGAALSIKAQHTIQYRTVFGKVSIDNPQLRVCQFPHGCTGSKDHDRLRRRRRI
jgi:hypothetical protein